MAVVEVACREVGAGLPVVLLHAFPLSSAMWLAQREALSAGCRVVTPDQRGFGGSPLGDDAPSLDRCADDLAALLDRRQLDRVVLGGLSMGGYVAMAFLRRHPGRVLGLLLADTRAGADDAAATGRREQVARRVVAEGTSAFVEESLPVWLGSTTTATRPKVVRSVRAQACAAAPAAVAWASLAMAGRSDALEVLAAADVPALVVVGDEDGLTPRVHAEELVATLPQGRLAVLPGAGHLPALETPDTFSDAVTDLLARVRQAAR